MGEAIGFEALHAATFVVNADEQIFAHLLNLSTQAAELLAVLPVACKQNNATNQWMFEAFAVLFGER
jgi:hypothetical protein